MQIHGKLRELRVVHTGSVLGKGRNGRKSHLKGSLGHMMRTLNVVFKMQVSAASYKTHDEGI